MDATEQHEALLSVERYSWGVAAATPGIAAIFARLLSGIQTSVGLPIKRAVSTLVVVPSGTTMISAPKRSFARRRLFSVPRRINMMTMAKPATRKAQIATTQLRKELPAMFLIARRVRFILD